MNRVLQACGGGRTLHLGRRAGASLDATVAMYRTRAVEATSLVVGADVLTPAWRLPFDDRSLDVVCAYGILDDLDAETRVFVFDEMLRVSRGSVLLQASGRTREEWEADCLRRGCRKHPLHQMLVPYEGLDWVTGPWTMLFAPIADDVSVGRMLIELAPERDLHMDMLREPGRRSDAHIARYMLARQFIRPGDRVLDAACGLGYGGAILADSTLAESVLGLDSDPWAIEYARDHYARGRSRLTFEMRDLATLESFSAGSFDAVVSFETLEHLADPDGFLAACRRLLTPAGRIVCSVPNQWVDDTGRDPNPHHLHVFDRAMLEARCRKHFLIERVYGQTAGGGMKLAAEGRALWAADDNKRDAEWWLLAGMTAPDAATVAPLRLGLMATTPDDETNVLAFERDYENPWLARAMVTIGLRAESSALLEEIAQDTLAASTPRSADAGAALCVSLYRHLERGSCPGDDLIARVDDYCLALSPVPHVRRWQISLRYAEALSWLAIGDTTRATRALELCAHSDALTFSPLLATKTVGAALLRGWLAAQARDITSARRWWKAGVDHAERALQRPWDEMLLDREAPALFGLREATLVVDLASRCAAGLHMLPHLVDRPGIVFSQIFDSLAERANTASLQARAAAAEAKAARLTELFAAQALLDESDGSLAGITIAVFGAGAGGRQAMASLRARGAVVDCIADNNASRHGETIDEAPIVDPATLPSRKVDMVAVASLPGRAAILAQLAGLGYQLGRDVAVMSPAISPQP